MNKVTKALSSEEIEKVKARANAAIADAAGPAVEEVEEFEYLDGAAEPAKHTLRAPMRFKGVDYREVTINPFYGEDFRRLAATAQMHPYEVAVIMTLTNLPATVVKRMIGADFADILEVCKGFLPQQFQGNTDEQATESGQSS